MPAPGHDTPPDVLNVGGAQQEASVTEPAGRGRARPFHTDSSPSATEAHSVSTSGWGQPAISPPDRDASPTQASMTSPGSSAVRSSTGNDRGVHAPVVTRCAPGIVGDQKHLNLPSVTDSHERPKFQFSFLGGQLSEKRAVSSASSRSRDPRPRGAARAVRTTRGSRADSTIRVESACIGPRHSPRQREPPYQRRVAPGQVVGSRATDAYLRRRAMASSSASLAGVGPGTTSVGSGGHGSDALPTATLRPSICGEEGNHQAGRGSNDPSARQRPRWDPDRGR